MAVCDKWVALKIVEFLMCVACLVTKRISQDDEARLALLLQKLSREWSLLTSVTWDSVGGAFADAIYGGYVIITFGLIVARVFQEIPRGRRILEGYFLGFGMLFFLILGGLELASLDSVPRSLVTNASVLGSFSLIVAALFLIDLMGPRIYTSTQNSQTDTTIVASPKAEKKVSIISSPKLNGNMAKPNEANGHANGVNGKVNGQANGHVPPERPKDLDLEKNLPDKDTKKEEMTLFQQSKTSYPNFDDTLEKDELQKSKFGSIRNGIEAGNYVRLSDPLSIPDRFHYEQELAKFNEKYLRDYLDNFAGKLSVKEDYLPEPQTPVFAKVKTGRLKGLYDEMSPTYEQKRSRSPTKAKTVPSPTLQQLEDYLRGSTRSKRADTPALFPMEPIEEKETTDTEGRASGTPTDPGYVQYTAGRWPDKRDLRTPRHSPTK
uniref:MARVEL domain-containing protein n=1 Tax=Heliothis virescens TaxID=7102 RepID=A0A2A4K5N1_HELVI